MRVFCCSYQGYVIEALTRLSRSDGWEPAYFQTTQSNDEQVRAAFPGAVRHNYMDAVKGRPASLFRTKDIEPNRAVLNELRENGGLATAMTMFKRNQSPDVPMDNDERAALIAWFSGYWTLVLSTLQVDLVIFEEVPHQVTDFILYACAKQLGTRCLVPIRTLPRGGFLVSDRFDDFTLSPRRRAYPIAPRYQPLVTYAELMRGEYADYARNMFFNAPDTMKMFSRAKPVAGPGLWRVIRTTAGRAVRAARLTMRFENDRKEAGKSFPESRQGFLTHRRNMQRTIAAKQQLRQLYQRLATDRAPTVGHPYIFCGLQYQPEASTCPRGGRFVDQLLMVQVLLAALPDGWRLAVKEHPNQFSGKFARFAETARSPAYYEALTSDPRVDLVSLETPSFVMVDGAKAVASVGGTICLEAAVRGTPSLNFGTAFFDKVGGIFKVIGEADASSAIAAIADGFKPDPAKVMADLRVVDDASFPGAIGGPATLKEVGLSQSDNAEIHAMSWLEWLEANPLAERL